MLLCLGNFSSEFHLFRYKRDSLEIADKKIEVNFIRSYDIHFKTPPTTVNVLNNSIQCKPCSGWAFLGLLTDGGQKAPPPLPKICHKYHLMMKLGTVILYLKVIQEIYESRDTPVEFC